jgi:heterodisulfide reductase subunit A
MADGRLVGAALVVGGGPAAMQAALDLSESGFKVYMVENTSSIGGRMAQLDKTFPTNDCSMCIISPKMVAVGRNENIELLTYAEVEGVSGSAGDFTVKVRKKAKFVHEDKCVGCGACAAVCPVKVDNEFDVGLAKRKAIYVPFPQAVPLKYTIDKEKCLHFKTGKCLLCVKACEANAIDHKMEDEVVELKVGAIILASGYDVFDASRKAEYGHSTYPNVLTNIEFERMLSASGPTEGHIKRPSDDKVPRSIAFIQCIGSRDAQTGNTYCSAYCCMAALKEAVIAQEHSPGLKTTIFFMDTRTFGKEFEEYLERAEHEYGVRVYRNNRVPKVQQDEATKNLTVIYHEGSDIMEGSFDMVVLSAGARPPASMVELAKTLGVKLNKFGFCDTDDLTPVETSVPGIFVCGALSGPKDIPDSVAQASGAAGKVAAILARERGKLITKKEFPAEKDFSKAEPRVGVFVCHCGVNIGSVVKVPEVAEYASKLPRVVFTDQMIYACSEDAQKRIKEMIEKHDLNRIVIASCTPRTHEPLFQNTVKEAGLNKYLFEMANIRDQCSWVHKNEPDKATHKAKDLVRMAVAKAVNLEALPQPKIPVAPVALVLGGGLSGMTAALGIAESGFEVHLVEKEKELGGHLKDIYHRTLGGVDPQQTLKDLRKAVSENRSIKLHLGDTLAELKGFVGNFESTLKSGEKFKHGAIVVATGGIEYSPKEYLYGEHPRIIRQSQLGALLANGEFKAKNVVIIQCVGSRDEEHPNCSRICCQTAMANAVRIKKEHPETNVFVLYRDIRTYGFAEEYYNEAASLGVTFLRYDPSSPPKVHIHGEHPYVHVNEAFIEQGVNIRADYLVLNAAVHPNPDNKDLHKLLKVPLTREGFFLEAHMKLRPVDFATDGIFLCGLAHSPRLIGESIAQALAAAARVNTVLSKDFIEAEGVVSVVDEAKCVACGRCEEVCEYGAPAITEVSPGVFKSRINEALCKGCGSCTVTCCSRAISSKHFRTKQIVTMIEACLAKEPEAEAGKA